MSPLQFAPYLGRILSRIFLLPLMNLLMRRRLKVYRDSTVKMIAQSLQVSKREASSIHRRSISSVNENILNYQFMCSKGVKYIQDWCDGIKILGAEKLTPFLTGNRPVLILTMHMGNFQLGFLKLVSTLKSERDLFVFKLNANDPNEDVLFSAFANHKQKPVALRVNEGGGRKAYLELRKGNIVTMMVDYEVNVTSRSEVDFFGRPCIMQNHRAR